MIFGSDQQAESYHVARRYLPFETLEDNLKKTKKLDFKQIGYKPDAGWFLKPKNYAALRNGVYDAQIEENGKNDGFSY